MSSRSETPEEVVSAPPVFFLHSEVSEDVTHVDICRAAERLVGFGSIVGAQRLGGLWRLYPTSPEVRAKLLTQKLLLCGKSIPLRSQNPFILRDGSGQAIPSTRLTIDGLPVSVASSDLEGYLRKAGASFRSSLMWERARDREGKLTRWVTGRRFVWIDLPSSPLPHRVQVGSFVARLFYREQPKPALVCYLCGKEGHRRGDPQCPGARSQQGEATEDRGSGGEEYGGEERGEGTDSEVGEEEGGSSEEEQCERQEEEGSVAETEENEEERTFTEDKESQDEEKNTSISDDQGPDSSEQDQRVQSREGTSDQKGADKKTGKKKKAKDKSKGGASGGNCIDNERGRQCQPTISTHFHRAPSLKRPGPPSPTDEGHEVQRPRRGN